MIGIESKHDLKNISLFLCTPDRTTIRKINDYIDINIEINADMANEITITIPYFVQAEFAKSRNPVVDMVKKKYMIRVEDFGDEQWYVVESINKKDDSATMEIKCYSAEYLLSDRKIIDLEIVSKSMTEILKQLLNNLSWDIKYVSPSLNIKRRSFDISEDTILDFIYGELSDSFDAVPVFNTKTQEISMYEKHEISKYTGLNITFNDYIKSTEDRVSTEDVITRLHVRGADGISISSVNPTGKTYIDDFSYFLYPFEMDEAGNVVKSSNWMSDDLAKALVTYNKYVSSKKNSFNDLLKNKKSLQEELVELQIKMSQLRTELAIILDEYAYSKKLGWSTTDVIKRRNAKNKEIKSLDSKINNINNKINSIDEDIESLKKDLSMEKHLSPSLLSELEKFIQEDVYNDTNKFDETDLYESALEKIDELNTPVIDTTLSLVNFFRADSEKYNWDRLNIHNVIKIEHDMLDIDIEATVKQIKIGINSETIDVVVSNRDRFYGNSRDKLEEMFYRVEKSITDYNKRKINWSKIAYNFNLRNDRIKTKPVKPTIKEGIKFKENDDGSVNLKLNWEYPDYKETKKNKHNIDGFLIYVYYDDTDEPYQFGSKMGEETIIPLPYPTRSYTIPSVPANLYYTIGIQAYRTVDEDINIDGILFSDMAKFNSVGGLTNVRFMMSSTIVDDDVPPPFQPKEEIDIKGRLNGAKWTVDSMPPETPSRNDIWVNPDTGKVSVYNGHDWYGDKDISAIYDAIKDNEDSIRVIDEKLKEEVERAQAELEEVMKEVESKVEYIESEVVPEVERALKETEIPSQPEPPEEIPESKMWNDTSYTPPRTMYWDEELSEWVSLSVTKDDIEDMMRKMRDSVERENKAYSKLEILKTRKYLSDRIDNVVEGALEDIQELLEIKDELIETANNIDAILDEYDGKFYNFEQTIDRINGQMSTTIENIERIDNIVEGHSSQIEQNTQEISAKVDSIIYERDKAGILTDIEQTQANLEILSNEIDLRVTKEEYNAGVGNLTDKITKAETSITQLAESILLKADKSELKNYVDVQEYTNKMALLDIDISKITQRVENTEISIDNLDGSVTDVANQVSNIEQTATKISQSVSELRGEFDGLEIGGRNILGNSRKPELRTNNSTAFPLRATEFDDYIRYEPLNGAGLSTYSQLNDSNYPIYDKNWLGKDMVVSMAVRVSRDVRLRFRFSDWGRTPSTTIKQEHFNVKASDGWVRISFHVPSELINRNPDTEYIRFLLYTVNDNGNIIDYSGEYVDSKEWKIAFGTKDSGWSPAPEDTNSRLSLAETSITQLSDQISLKASQVSVDGLTERMVAAESEISAMPDMISLAVRDGIERLETSDRNIILNSDTKRSSTSYLVYGYHMSEDWELDTEYTIAIKGSINSEQRFGIWANGSSTRVTYLNYDSKSGLHIATFKTPKNINATTTKRVYVYNYPSSGATSATIEWIKLAKGNIKITDWSPAPEDQVNKTNVLSSINLSPEGVKIQGDKIDIAGLVEFINNDTSSSTMIDGGRIVTQSITANQLNIEKIFGNSAVISKIQSDIVKTAELNASKITSGTLSAARIGANSITASKLNVSNLAAISANLGSITAGNIDANKVSIDNKRVSIGSHGIKIVRPDGAVWMENGMVQQEYTISSYDPYDMTLGVFNFEGSKNRFPLFYEDAGFYRAYHYEMIGRDGYEDVRDSSKNYTAKFTTYEFIHSARYFVIGYRTAANSTNPRHKVAVYDGSKELYLEWHARGGGSRYSPVIIDLGKPTYKRKTLEFRVGATRSDTSGQDRIAFRINRVYQTDHL